MQIVQQTTKTTYPKIEEYLNVFLLALWSTCSDTSLCIYLSSSLNHIPF